jgi:hypothetical protein
MLSPWKGFLEERTNSSSLLFDDTDDKNASEVDIKGKKIKISFH